MSVASRLCPSKDLSLTCHELIIENKETFRQRHLLTAVYYILKLHFRYVSTVKTTTSVKQEQRHSREPPPSVSLTAPIASLDRSWTGGGEKFSRIVWRESGVSAVGLG